MKRANKPPFRMHRSTSQVTCQRIGFVFIVVLTSIISIFAWAKDEVTESAEWRVDDLMCLADCPPEMLRLAKENLGAPIRFSRKEFKAPLSDGCEGSIHADLESGRVDAVVALLRTILGPSLNEHAARNALGNSPFETGQLLCFAGDKPLGTLVRILALRSDRAVILLEGGIVFILVPVSANSGGVN